MRSNYCFIQRYSIRIFFTCYISPNHSKNLVTLYKIDAAILHCSESFMLAFIVTPKYFSITVFLRIVPPISQFMPAVSGPVCRHLHFRKLNNICHFSDHLTNLSMSSCNICLSTISLVFLKRLVSSAHFNILLVTPSSKSLMYILTTNLAAVVCVCAKFDQFLPARSYFESIRPENFVRIAKFPYAAFGPLFAFHCPLFFTRNNDLECKSSRFAVVVRRSVADKQLA